MHLLLDLLCAFKAALHEALIVQLFLHHLFDALVVMNCSFWSLLENGVSHTLPIVQLFQEVSYALDLDVLCRTVLLLLQ